MQAETPYPLKITPEEYEALERRLGAERLARRIECQTTIWQKLVRHEPTRLHGTNCLPSDSFIEKCFRYSGLLSWGKRNMLDLRVVEHAIKVPRLPRNFEGYRILQISDPHFDISPEILPRLLKAIDGLEYDMVALTGDYRNSSKGDFSTCLNSLEALMAQIGTPAYAVLGNHDYIEMAHAMERIGMVVLLNESAVVTRSKTLLFIAGIDDSTYSRTHDIKRARTGIPNDACVILLAHSPNVYEEAAGLNYSYVLSGHTHGGQVCLPGGYPLVNNAGIPRQYLSGSWIHKGLPGYTSRGVGACGVPVRFNCLPEVTLHTLHCP